MNISARSFRLIIGASTALSTSLLCAAALADDTGESEGPDVEELVILSAPLGTSLSEATTGTTILGRDSILDQLDGQIGQTLLNQPGISASSFGPGASRPIIRGLGGDRTRILINGLGTFDVSTTSPDHPVAIDTSNAVRVEIIRGPGALQFGPNGIGGVINVFDGRIPLEKPEGGYDLDLIGSFSTVDEGFQISGRTDIAVTKNFIVHFDGNFRDSQDIEIDGFASVDPGPDDEFGVVPNTFTETVSASAGGTYFFDWGFIGASFNYQDGVFGIPPGLEPDVPEDGIPLDFGEDEEGEEEEEEEGPVGIDFDQIRFDLIGEVNADFLIFETAKLKFGYGDYEHVEFEVESGEGETFFFNNEYELGTQVIQKPVDNFLGGTLRGAFGANFRNRDFAALGPEEFVPENTQFQFGFSVFQQLDLEPLLFEFAARYDRQRSETDDLLFTGEAFETNFNTYSLSGSAHYHFQDRYVLTLNLSRTERAPNPEELFSFGPQESTQNFTIGDAGLDSEKAFNAEIGFKKTLGRGQFDVNLFYNNFDGFIAFTPTGEVGDGLPVFAFVQEDAFFFGVEFGADFTVFEREQDKFTLDAVVDYVIAEETEGDENDPLPFIPPLRAAFGGTYERDYFTLNAQVQFVDDQFRTAAFEDPTDGYIFFNAGLTFRPFKRERNIAIQVRGRNLTNSLARVSTSILNEISALPGRDVRISLRVGF
ncbi:MAG: TonB-dependent receptor [Pseudomonadota bacterium]